MVFCSLFVVYYPTAAPCRWINAKVKLPHPRPVPCNLNLQPPLCRCGEIVYSTHYSLTIRRDKPTGSHPVTCNLRCAFVSLW